MDDSVTIMRSQRICASDNIKRLFSELSGCERTPDVDRINNLIDAGSLAFYLALDGGTPVGMASVIPCRTAASDKLWIEDVCVLSEWRGKGIARKLMQFAMADSEEFFGKGTFWLTSRPSRTAARRMYRSFGFVEHETGVFKLDPQCQRP